MRERTYRMQEGRFALPAGLRDDTVNIFTGQESGFENTSLVINRVKRDAVGDLKSYVLEQMDGFQKNLPGYGWRRGARIDIHGVAGFEIEFAWRSRDGMLHQWQIYVPNEPHGAILVLTFSARGEIGDAHRRAVLRMLETFQPDQPDGA